MTAPAIVRLTPGRRIRELLDLRPVAPWHKLFASRAQPRERRDFAVRRALKPDAYASGLGSRRFIVYSWTPKGSCFQEPFGTLVATPYHCGGAGVVYGSIPVILPHHRCNSHVAGCVPGTRPRRREAPATPQGGRRSSASRCITPCQAVRQQDEFPACRQERCLAVQSKYRNALKRL